MISSPLAHPTLKLSFLNRAAEAYHVVDVRNEGICQAVTEGKRVWEESEVMGPGAVIGGDGPVMPVSTRNEAIQAARASLLQRYKTGLDDLSPISWMGCWVHVGRECYCYIDWVD
jgi:hypothetical protein